MHVAFSCLMLNDLIELLPTHVSFFIKIPEFVLYLNVCLLKSLYLCYHYANILNAYIHKIDY